MTKTTKKRIIGIDVARALAVIGMIIVNFKVVFGETGDHWIKPFANFFSGKAAATFVVLAGVGLALMTNSAVKNQDAEKLRKGRIGILKRALFLFVIGLSYAAIWPADILHFYGIYMLLTLFFINRSSRQILLGTGALVLLFPLLYLFFDYEQGWIFELWHYTDFWTLEGFFRNLFFNGFHPVIPWAAFMLFGLWYGRQNLYDATFLRKSLIISTLVFLGIQALSITISPPVPGGAFGEGDFLSLLCSTDPMPPLPLYMLNGMSIAIAVISACIL
ncbi:MAG: heparan-alpha-glucosaminide N-acetyltransferase domain-containing protein, partial [Bacteroidota bacterium]